ncbi:hypothetical protein JCM8547_008413 [Rhodosporidiobolus lusitaniae]
MSAASSAAFNGAPHSSISGPDYLSALSSFIRTHEASLANYYALRPPAKQHAPPSWTTVLTLGIVPTAESSSSPSPTPRPTPPRRDPLVLKFDPHHLYYLLLKFDELGIAGAGELDVKVDRGTSRPMSVDYSSLVPPGGPSRSGSILGGMFGLGGVNGSAKKADDAASVTSGISSFSFGSGWWGLGGGKEQADEASNVRYIYSSCTKLPALKLSPFKLTAATATGSKDATPALVRVVQGFEDCPPPATCVPLLAFKNLSSLVLEDLDPRGFLGWDVLSVQLRSLGVHRGGIEDIGELICDAPVEDEARRAATEHRGRAVGSERRKRAEGCASLGGEDLLSTIQDDNSQHSPASPATAAYPTPSKLAWSSLRHLSLSENALTFIPSPPLTFLPTLTSLDLSSNLLISIPPGLAHLTSLRFLNLSDNMIDSLLGVSKALGAIEVLNLSHNRLENLSGLDRLPALERLDVRANHLDEALEISRVARLPHLREVWVKENPFARKKEEGGEENWRIKIFGYFADEEAYGHRDLAAGEIRIDGTGMGMAERRAVEAESSRKGTPLGRRRASTGAADRPAETRNGEAKVVGRRVVTAAHRPHHQHPHHRASSPPPSHLSQSTSASTAPAPPSELDTPASSRPVSVALSSKSPAKKRRKPRRIVDLDADPSHPTAPSSSAGGNGQYSDSDPTSSSTDVPPAATHGRSLRPSTVDEEPTTSTTDDALSSSLRGSNHQRYASSPQTTRIAGISSVGPSSSLSPSSAKRTIRRDRVSASTYEPATTSAATFGGGGEVESSGEAFRRRIEKLREEVGESYLSVLGEREAMEEMRKQKGVKEVEAEGKDKAEGEEGKEEEDGRPAEEPVGGEMVEAATAKGGAAPAGGGGDEEEAAVAPAMKAGVKVVKKKKGKGKKR